MSASNKRGAAQLAKEIGDLYLSKSFSDVTIVINDTELPAHRVILSQRCPYFNKMFSNPWMESTSERINHETLIDGFKLVLKWIYTGEIAFTQKETAEEVQRLSDMYLLTELDTVSMKCVKEFNGTSFEMPISDQSGVAQLAEEIGKLCLKRDFSDVTVVVNGTELPAHRMILSQRCTYLKNMLEKTPNRIEISETRIDCVESVLKWIYTGDVEFSQMDTTLEVLRLSKMYKLVELEELAGEYVEKNCKIGNVFLVLNNFALLPEDQDWIEDRLDEIVYAFLKHETFSTLTKDGLSTLLKSELQHTTNAEMLEAFVRWMKANPDKSKHFRDLLKQISLNSISLGELVSIVPSDLISGNMLIEVAREQQVMYESGRVVNTNFAVLKYGAKINVAGKNVFYPARFYDELYDETQEVVIDLGQRFKVNNIYATRYADYSETSHIEISVSTDEANWTCVVDRRSVDEDFNVYDFEGRVVRFIRISSDRPLKHVFELDLFEVGYEE